MEKLTDKRLRETIERLTDGEFIDLLDTLLGFEFGLTATEWIEHQYKRGATGVVEAINELQGNDDDLIETYSKTR
jgi:hypothetical protein